ncbi:MAG: ATP-grasp domain-containing protein [Chloroflexi bacterium]|nr:ATP-grasp domain-containing protein [Chloroflexota bacterium]
MPVVLFAAPVFTETAVRFIEATAKLPDVYLGVVSQEPQELLSLALQARLAGHWRIDNALDSQQLAGAVQALSGRLGPVYRLLGIVEQIQLPLAEVREWLGIEGMVVATARNFRDKSQMKNLLRAAGLPCARHRLAHSEGEVWAFIEETGYPVVVKPPAGAASQATFRAENAGELQAALAANSPQPDQPVLLEEFITGQEHSFETFSRNGQHLWHSLTHYFPTPLEVMRTPWIQWGLLLPREIDGPQYDDIRQVGGRVLDVLGMDTGLSHLEWFRRTDGSIAVSEVGARPPGAQITTMMSRANNFDCLMAWARLMVYGEFEPPQRKYAVGAAFLRGQGQGKVKAIHGLEQADREVGHLVTDVKLPKIGQSPGVTYEGEGYIILRHPETEVVKQAIFRLVSLIRVELG